MKAFFDIFFFCSTCRARAEWRKRNGETDDDIEELKRTLNDVPPNMFPRTERDNATLADGISKEGTGRFVLTLF